MSKIKQYYSSVEFNGEADFASTASLCMDCWVFTVIKSKQPHPCAACLGKKFQPTPATELDFMAAFGIPRPSMPVEVAQIQLIADQLDHYQEQQEQQMAEMLAKDSK